jgi:AhpD family alkylhydroperoxidase
MDISYPEHLQHLRGLSRRLAKELPGPVSAFGQLHDRALADGALDRKTKELIALAIAITSRCQGCVAYHVHDALHAGATRAEVLETVGVALMMGGGPAAVYGCEALEALDQFEAAK